MKTRNVFVISLLVSVLAWVVFTWPLPLRAGSAIPAGSQAHGLSETKVMPPGDHLQLLYHFWLFSDMLKGDWETVTF